MLEDQSSGVGFVAFEPVDRLVVDHLDPWIVDMLGFERRRRSHHHRLDDRSSLVGLVGWRHRIGRRIVRIDHVGSLLVEVGRRSLDDGDHRILAVRNHLLGEGNPVESHSLLVVVVRNHLVEEDSLVESHSLLAGRSHRHHRTNRRDLT